MSPARSRWYRRTRQAVTPSPTSADSVTTTSAVVAPSPPIPRESGLSTTGGAATSGGGSTSHGSELSESATASEKAPNTATTITVKSAATTTRIDRGAPFERPANDGSGAPPVIRGSQAAGRGARPRRLRPLSTLAYVIIGAVLLAISLGTAGAVYATTAVPYRAACVFRASLPLAQQTGPDFFAANQYLAMSEVGYGRLNGVYEEAAAATGADANAVREASVDLPTPPNDFITITAKAPHADTAAASANALCQSYARHVNAQRTSMRDAEANDLRQRISDLNQRLGTLTSAGPPTSVEDKVQVDGLQAGITRATTTLAATLSRQSDSVDVVALAQRGVRIDDRNLAANLFYAGGAAILLTFAVVLVCEIPGNEQLSRALRLRWVPR